MAGRQNTWIPPELREKNQEEAVKRLKVKRKETRKFLRDIEEQRKDGLLTENTYKNLKIDYSLQLRVIEGTLVQLDIQKNNKNEEYNE